MKKIITNLVAITLFSIILTGCSKKPEDACDCIAKAANDFMVQGVKIESIDDLREPCKDLIDKFKDDAAGRALIIAKGQQVLESLQNKEFIKIEGEELPAFPTYTFNTLAEFIEAEHEKGGNYKYWKTELTIKNAFIGPITHKDDSVYVTYGFSDLVADFKDKNIWIKFPKKQFDSTFTKSIALEFGNVVFDSKINNFIKYNYNILSVIKHQLEYPNGDGWVETQYRDQLKNIINQPGYENFVQDLKNGRYLWIDEIDYESLKKNDFRNKNILCLTTASITGKFINGSIFVSNASFKHSPLPKIFEKRSKIDVSRFLGISDE